jgi:hypothetical protein
MGTKRVLRGTVVVMLVAMSTVALMSSATAGGKNDLSASPRRLSFGSHPLSSYTTMDVTITNDGSSFTNFTSGVGVTGWFAVPAETNHCAITGLAPGESCTLSVAFEPGETGHLTGLLTFNDSNPPTTFTVQLVGRGTAT